MSVPPNLTPPSNPAASGFTHHMHHLGSFHPTIDPKTMPSPSGLGAHHQHYQWDRPFRHGYHRAPVRTKVLWVSSYLTNQAIRIILLITLHLTFLP
jgi:hypothetical protein